MRRCLGLLEQGREVRFYALEYVALEGKDVAVDFHVEARQFRGKQGVFGGIDYAGVDPAGVAIRIGQAELQFVAQQAGRIVKCVVGKQRAQKLGFLLQALLEGFVVGLLEVLFLDFFAQGAGSIR